MMEPDMRGVYHIFIASPGDVQGERDTIRGYFSHLNRTVAPTWGVQFEVVDWEKYSTAGVGRPQELITAQTLERFRASLVLVIVVMAQRFGTPSADHESGTQEEIEWALASKEATGYPEVKFFFRHIQDFIAPPERKQIMEAFAQWERVCEFRDELKAEQSSLVREYPDAESFETALKQDLDIWINAADRPWARTLAETPRELPDGQYPAREYFQSLIREYQWLDISGIDSDRAFKLPLEQIYVRLRVISGNASEGETAQESAEISIQAALERSQRLVIVGDPGSGKSTFLRFIALILAQCALSDDTFSAAEKLSIDEPLPVPLYLSCWDLSEHLRQKRRGNLSHLVEFISERACESGWQVNPVDLEGALKSGKFIFLIDGLDEVPTESGRNLVSGLIEKFVEKYPQHRFVVTSRVRAYTGETVLDQQFTRCDIQPFGAPERRIFLRNWVSQLFGVGDQTHRDDAAADAELEALANAIETSSIRSLATNPLLLTVIAIVHWNRKRLPDRRVDLYNQCIDVLLGQRKQAEQQRASGDTTYLHEEKSKKRLREQAWVRKRFADIAFAILDMNEDEIGHAAVVALLEPYFRDAHGEMSREEAESFLDEQELRSGLLVHRHSKSYRFVHLTFQEYLAAWHLANRELADTLVLVKCHLRDPRWFETLQLLGGELANRSDEYLDRYVSAVLDGAGDTIREQAPVIALCANIVRDTQAVAGLSAETQSRYDRLVRDTFDAFKPSSRVPSVTQLDLLEALGEVGAPAKDQLIAATSSRLLDVRRRALEILIPHLSDDDLFSMSHLLADRSKEPVKTYLNAMVEKDRVRAARLVLGLSRYGSKTIEAVLESRPPKLPEDRIATWPYLVFRIMERFTWDFAVRTIDGWEDTRKETAELIARLAREGIAEAIPLLRISQALRMVTWELIAQLDEAAIIRLAEQYLALDTVGLHTTLDRKEIWDFVARLARHGGPEAILALLRYAGDREETWELIARLDDRAIVRLSAQLSAHPSMGDDFYRGYREEKRELIERLARQGVGRAIVWLAEHYGYREATWELIASLDEAAIRRLANPGFRDYEIQSVITLTKYLSEREEIKGLLAQLARHGSEVAIRSLSASPGGRETWELTARLARQGIGLAVVSLAARWGERDATWKLIGQLDDADFDRMAGQLTYVAVRGLIQSQGDRQEAWTLIERLARHGDPQAISGLIDARGNRDETWALIRHLDDEAVRRLVEDRDVWPIVALAERPTPREEFWALIERLARQGSMHAVLRLVEHRGSRQQTWELIAHLSDQAVARLAQQASRGAILGLVDRRGNRDEIWQLIERLARLGDGQAIVCLVGHRGDVEETWSLVAQVAQEGVADARCLLAWRDWALATAGPDALRSLSGSAAD